MRTLTLLAVSAVISLASCGSVQDARPDPLPEAPTSLQATDGRVELHLTFDDERTSDGARAFDPRDDWPAAEVVESREGVLTTLAGADATGRAIQFPASCSFAEDCERALVQLPHDSRLDPSGDAFEFGAVVRVAPDQTGRGSNIVQKGRFGTPGGQWKLQVDGHEGRPSCVMQGDVAGQRKVVRLVADLSIADDEWHRVVCMRDADSVSISIDGSAKSVDVVIGTLRNSADVRVGASGSDVVDDQFHGAIDEVFYCAPSCQ